MVALGEPRIDEVLRDRCLELVEPDALGCGLVVVWQLGQCPSAHESRCLAQGNIGGGRAAPVELGAACRQQFLQSVRVDLPPRRTQLIARRARKQGCRVQGTGPQPRDIGPEHGHRVRWYAGRPQDVSHPVGRDGLVAVQEQQREHCALLWAAELHLATVPPGRRWTEQSVTDHGSPAWGTSTVAVSRTDSCLAARACASKSGAAHISSVRPSSPPSMQANAVSPSGIAISATISPPGARRTQRAPTSSADQIIPSASKVQPSGPNCS